MLKAILIVLVSVAALAAGITAKIYRHIVNVDPLSHKLLVAAAFMLISAVILTLIAWIVPAIASTDYGTCEYLFTSSGWDVFRCK